MPTSKKALSTKLQKLIQSLQSIKDYCADHNLPYVKKCNALINEAQAIKDKIEKISK